MHGKMAVIPTAPPLRELHNLSQLTMNEDKILSSQLIRPNVSAILQKAPKARENFKPPWKRSMIPPPPRLFSDRSKKDNEVISQILQNAAEDVRPTQTPQLAGHGDDNELYSNMEDADSFPSESKFGNFNRLPLGFGEDVQNFSPPATQRDLFAQYENKNLSDEDEKVLHRNEADRFSEPDDDFKNPDQSKRLKSKQFGDPVRKEALLEVLRTAEDMQPTPMFRLPNRRPLFRQDGVTARIGSTASRSHEGHRVTPEAKFPNNSGNHEFQHRVPRPFTTNTPASYIIDDRTAEGGRKETKLRSVSEIPARYQSIFTGFSYFNIVQSQVLNDALYTDKPLVVCAPTGSGKTVVFELATIRLLVRLGEAPMNYKIVYMAPVKALCSERYLDWSERFSRLGLKCTELTGDTLADDYHELHDAHVVLTTPEKWDSITRRWRENMSLVQRVRLFLIDEVHLLNDETRGPTLEAVVSRMKMVQAAICREADMEISSAAGLRFVAVSATLPNASDIGEWLSSDDISASVHKKGTVQAALTLVKATSYVAGIEHKQKLVVYSNHIRDGKLRDAVLCGVGYHHAGMDVHDRRIIEDIFSCGVLLVLYATSTLAMGVNLPAHLVIIKSTQYYDMGVSKEYSETQVLQMIGRAGRPQFDTSATAVIMTKETTRLRYEKLLSGKQTIESSLHLQLTEHLNAEIVLCTITDVEIALEWLRSTFLYMRVMKNPRHYGIPVGLTRDQVEERLQDICMNELYALSSAGCIKMDDGFDIKQTETGRLMARYCVAFKTMKMLAALSGNLDLEDLLKAFASSQEFRDIVLRVSEKKSLNELNHHKTKEAIRYPMKGKIKTSEMKISCLIQATLGSLNVTDFSLLQDVTKIFRSVTRISKLFVEFLLTQTLADNLRTLVSACVLSKCLKAKMWETSKYVSRQLEKIGPKLAGQFVAAGLTDFGKIAQTNPRELEMIVNRNPPFGNSIKDAVSLLPVYELKVNQAMRYKNKQAEITVTVNLTNWEMIKKKSTAGLAHTCILIVGDADNSVVFKQKVRDRMLINTGSWTKNIEVNRSLASDELTIYYLSEEWVGLDIHMNFTPFYTQTQVAGINDFYARRNQMACAQPPGGSTTKYMSEPDQLPFSFLPPGIDVNCGRQCAHRCAKKLACGHLCCKTGVLQDKGGSYRTSMLQRHLDQMHSKRKNLPDTPGLKRFKANNQLKSVNLEQYAYNPKNKVESLKSLQSANTNLKSGARPTPTVNLSCALKPRIHPRQIPQPTPSIVVDRSGTANASSGWEELDNFWQHRKMLAQGFDKDLNSFDSCDVAELTGFHRGKFPNNQIDKQSDAKQSKYTCSSSPSEVDFSLGTFGLDDWDDIDDDDFDDILIAVDGDNLGAKYHDSEAARSLGVVPERRQGKVLAWKSPGGQHLQDNINVKPGEENVCFDLTMDSEDFLLNYSDECDNLRFHKPRDADNVNETDSSASEKNHPQMTACADSDAEALAVRKNEGQISEVHANNEGEENEEVLISAKSSPRRDTMTRMVDQASTYTDRLIPGISEKSACRVSRDWFFTSSTKPKSEDDGFQDALSSCQSFFDSLF